MSDIIQDPATTIRILREKLSEANEALALAYPRALQAAAGVVAGATGFRTPERREWLVDAILELSAEQIEAWDAAQREATP